MTRGVKKNGEPRKPRCDRIAALSQDAFTFNPNSVRELKGESYANAKNTIRESVSEKLNNIDFNSFQDGKSLKYFKGSWHELVKNHKGQFVMRSED